MIVGGRLREDALQIQTVSIEIPNALWLDLAN